MDYGHPHKIIRQINKKPPLLMGGLFVDILKFQTFIPAIVYALWKRLPKSTE